MHAKIAIVDDRWLTLGSANLNDHSLFNDTEMNVVCCDEDLVRATRLRLWAEHLEMAAEDVAGDPASVFDELWRPLAQDELGRRRRGEPPQRRLHRAAGSLAPHEGAARPGGRAARGRLTRRPGSARVQREERGSGLGPQPFGGRACLRRSRTRTPMTSPLRKLLLATAALLALAPAATAAASRGQQTFFESPALLLNPVTRPATLSKLQRLGVKSLRVELSWHAVAPAANSTHRPAFDATNPAAYNWSLV